ncbi:MAG: HEAT repeat domain-containing protein [Pirellulales bacterium]|nr:HEAT repeat domain-containing protein [Pirellulales bacterium]
MAFLPLFGLLGLFLAGQQLYPRLAAAHWKRQLADAPLGQVEILLEQIAALDEDGIPVLVAALASEREAVAGGAHRRLLDRLERWKTLPREEYSSRILILAENLAAQVSAYGPAARSDAHDLAAQLLLDPSQIENPLDRARLIAACDEVFQATTAVRGELTSPPQIVQANSARPSFEDRIASRPYAWEIENSRKTTSKQFDLVPNGGLPSEEPPAAEGSYLRVLPAETGDTPPSYFQEPPKSRALDFSNRTSPPLEVPEAALPRNARREPSPIAEPPFKSLVLEAPAVGRDAALLDPRSRETVDLMRQLAQADGDRAETIRAELRRRGLSAGEIAVAARMFDPDPAARKQLVAELPGMAEIDASAWLLQCCKDEDAEVRLAAFSLLATSKNPLLLKKLDLAAQNDPDARIQRLAERIRVEGRR